jgi:predicted ATPase
MLTSLQVQNFKSWQDTGEIRLAPITGFFGANSSGKTAILQLLLLLKQTAESADRTRVLQLGDDRTYVDLGTFYDVTFGHHAPGVLAFELAWTMPELKIDDPEGRPNRPLFATDKLRFAATIRGDKTGGAVEKFVYHLEKLDPPVHFGMQRKGNGDKTKQYDLDVEGYTPKRTPGRPWPLPSPAKFYGFPDQVSGYFQNMGFASVFGLALEEAMSQVYYLGPLREYPHRSYIWTGEPPRDVGRRGELAVPALLAAQERNLLINRGYRKRRQRLDERVAQWLRELGLIDSFEMKALAPNRKEYEVRVRRTAGAPTVLITDVGFGVSQILPVLTLCYYAPEGSTLLLEQPEIHLHPSVQAGLADVFIDACRTRNIQILIESHSEHLLRRLQRRIAEEVLPANDAAFYFVQMQQAASHLHQLDVDMFGNIRNWPQDFFGDEMGDLIAMTEAAERRQQQNGTVG